MQLNEIGSGHSQGTHHVTTCMHDHAQIDKVGKMGSASASSGAGVQSMMAAESQADAQFSLAEWLDKTLNSGRRLWGKIWGDADAAGVTDSDRGSGSERGAQQISAVLPLDGSRSGPQTLHSSQIETAAAAVPQSRDIHDNPYFSAVKEPDDSHGNLLRRTRQRLENMAGRFTGRFPGKFSGTQTRNSFQARQERTQKDLRRRSKFRRDELVIDCVLTDDSYLLDSYDRNGEYSKLSAGK